jgi:hypothetical protein
MNEITANYLIEIEQLLSKTQASPWRSYIEGRDHTSGSNFIMTGESTSRGSGIELSGATDADQDFMAIAHEVMPALIAEVRRLNKWNK